MRASKRSNMRSNMHGHLRTTREATCDNDAVLAEEAAGGHRLTQTPPQQHDIDMVLAKEAAGRHILSSTILIRCEKKQRWGNMRSWRRDTMRTMQGLMQRPKLHPTGLYHGGQKASHARPLSLSFSLSLYIYIYILIWLYVHIYLYIKTYVYIFIHSYIYIYINNIQIHMNIYICI